MQVKEIEIPYRLADREFHLYCIGDIHGGTIHCVEHEIKRKVKEISEDKNALWIGMGDYCMPLQTEILTKNGFKHVSQLAIGESVLAYDAVDATLKWTPLLKIYQAPSLPMIEMQSKSFYAKCTPNHNWFVQDSHSDRPSKGTVRKETINLRTHHRIVISAPLNKKSKEEIKLSDEEAAILGWIVTDGTIRTSPILNVSVVQCKEPYKSFIRNRFKNWFTKEYVEDDYKSTFNIKTSKARDLFNKCKTHPEDIKQELPWIVTRISESARYSMMQAMCQAEGWLEKGSWHFSQKKGKVLDSFQILAILNGLRTGRLSTNNSGVEQLSVVRQTPVDVNNLKITALPQEPAWCPTTQYGSWVFRLNGQVGITGNCEWITPKDKRFDPNQCAVAEWVEPDNLGESQTKWIVDLFSPIKNKCVGLLYGNHEDSIRVFNHENVQKNICERLGVDNLGYSAFVKFKFTRDKSHYILTGCFTHGAGCAITEGAKMNSLTRWMKSNDADIYGYAHLHDFIEKGISRMIVNDNGKIKSHTAIGAITGSWFRTYTQGNISSYGERKCYPPTEIGCAMFTIIPPGNHLNNNYFKIDVSRSV